MSIEYLQCMFSGFCDHRSLIGLCTLVLACCLFVAASAAGDFTVSRVKEARVGGSKFSNWKRWSYSRDRAVILTCTISAPEKRGSFDTAAYTFRTNGSSVFTITFNRGRLSSFFTTKILNVRIDLQDVNHDQIPDFLSLESADGKVLDAFVVANGGVIPLDDKFLEAYRADLIRDDKGAHPTFYDRTLPGIINRALSESDPKKIGVPKLR